MARAWGTWPGRPRPARCWPRTVRSASVKQPGHEPARAARPQHNHVAAGEPAQVRGGEVQADPGQRDALGADRGLRAGPLTGLKGRVNQAGDGRAGGAGSGGRADRSLDLGDDLILADGHRVQPARDREQVLRDRAAKPDPGHRHDLVDRDVPARGQLVSYRGGHPSGWTGRGGVDLHPVTGRQDQRLVDFRHRAEPGQHFAEFPGRHGELLQHLGRNETVRQAQAHDRHHGLRSAAGCRAFLMLVMENRQRPASRMDSASTAAKSLMNSEATPTPTTGMIRPV
jgi:hypothetical protein